MSGECLSRIPSRFLVELLSPNTQSDLGSRLHLRIYWHSISLSFICRTPTGVRLRTPCSAAPSPPAAAFSVSAAPRFPISFLSVISKNNMIQANTHKPLITVVGAASKQGRSVAHALLDSGSYRVRALTRHRDSQTAQDLAQRGPRGRSCRCNPGCTPN